MVDARVGVSELVEDGCRVVDVVVVRHEDSSAEKAVADGLVVDTVHVVVWEDVGFCCWYPRPWRLFDQ